MTGTDKPRPQLTVHEKARSAFEARAVALKQQLGSTTVTARPATWKPDVHTTPVGKSDLVGPSTSRAAGPAPYVANVIAGTGVGLVGPVATEFESLCSVLHKAIQPKRTVDCESVRSSAESWLFETGSLNGLADYCLGRLQQQLKSYEVLVPIHDLHVQSPLLVGEVTFEELSEATIERWHHSPGYSALSDDDRPHVDAFFERFSKTHRGHAIARVAVWAVRTQAVDHALRHVETALGLLRFFAPAALVSELRSTCVPFGRERKEEFVAVLESASVYEGMQTGLLDGEAARPWFVSNEEMREIKNGGLDVAGALLDKSTRTAFEDAVLSSISLFSESALERRAHIRLLLVFSALEGLYLANDSEQIVANLRCRLAAAAEPQPAEWSRIRGLIDSTYHKRSAFVHHGVTFDIDEIPGEFFVIAWTGIHVALHNASRFPTVADFARSLDQLQALDQKP